ncbi:MAG: hypothetical protein ACLSTI_01395 [Ruminococcus sp.]
MRKDREAAKRLLHAIGDIDDQYLLEAEEQPMKQTKSRFQPLDEIRCLAACAGIVLTSGILIQQERNKSHLTPTTTQQSQPRPKKACRFPAHSFCATLQAAATSLAFRGCSGCLWGI